MKSALIEYFHALASPVCRVRIRVKLILVIHLLLGFDYHTQLLNKQFSEVCVGLKPSS